MVKAWFLAFVNSPCLMVKNARGMPPAARCRHCDLSCAVLHTAQLAVFGKGYNDHNLDGDLSWYHHDLLVGGDWNMNFMIFHSVGNFISSQLTKSMIFQRGRYTTNQFTKKNVDLYGVVYPTTEKFHGISFSWLRRFYSKWWELQG